jgi:hypothetical protein
VITPLTTQSPAGSAVLLLMRASVIEAPPVGKPIFPRGKVISRKAAQRPVLVLAAVSARTAECGAASQAAAPITATDMIPDFIAIPRDWRASR